MLDPFAGGSVRGIVAASLGLHYCGLELREDQVAANVEQMRTILAPSAVSSQLPLPRWINADSRVALRDPVTRGIPRADLVFTCPPYGDLERYSDIPADLSTMSAGAFAHAYAEILSRSVERLLDDRFAVVVVGNYRSPNGVLRDLVGFTIRAMRDAGAQFYNDAVLLNSTGNGAMRARKQFETSRKLVRLHQMVLTFVKGDPRAATAAITGPASDESR